MNAKKICNVSYHNENPEVPDTVFPLLYQWSLYFLAVVTAIDKTAGRLFYVALKFKDDTTQKEYLLTGNGKDKDITTVVSKNLPYLSTLLSSSSSSSSSSLSP